jgi:drug/metabolite transporter (DMT)-like permease
MPSSFAIGVAAALASAVFGAGWQLVTRHGVTTTLGPLDLAVLRYAVPAVLLLPLWWGLAAPLRKAGLPLVVFTVLTGGLPFGLLISSGAQWAPAAHIAVFTSGTIPMLAALIGWVAWREPVGAWRAGGFALVLAGVVLLALRGQVAGEGYWRGDLLFLLAGLSWAAHTHAFRRTGFTAWQGAAVANGGSALLLFALLPFAAPLKLWTAPWQDVALQAVWQSAFGGVLGVVTYMAAVRHIGAQRAALSAAVVPPMTAVGEVAFLGAPVQPAVMLSAALVAVGVLLAGGLFGRGAVRTAPARDRGSA